MFITRLLSFFTLSIFALVVKAESYADLHASIERISPSMKVVSIEETPMFGMYKVAINTGDTLYMSADGEHFFTGVMYQNRVGEGLVNLTEIAQQSARVDALKSEAAQDAWVFPALGQTQASITIFTDVDCYYCQKLHAEMGQINALGIEVRYLAFPRAGLGSPSHQVMADAWCADDPNEFFTEAKQRSHDKLPPLASPTSCDNPVADHYALSQQLGLAGTPAIVLDTGELWPGYLPAPELARRLGIN